MATKKIYKYILVDINTGLFVQNYKVRTKLARWAIRKKRAKRYALITANRIKARLELQGRGIEIRKTRIES
jgi:hypothetical protein